MTWRLLIVMLKKKKKKKKECIFIYLYNLRAPRLNFDSRSFKIAKFANLAKFKFAKLANLAKLKNCPNFHSRSVKIAKFANFAKFAKNVMTAPDQVL